MFGMCSWTRCSWGAAVPSQHSTWTRVMAVLLKGPFTADRAIVLQILSTSAWETLNSLRVSPGWSE